MTCKECRFWVGEKPSASGVPVCDVAFLDTLGLCRRYPQEVIKEEDSFCGEYEPKTDDQLTEDEKFERSLKPTWDDNAAA